MYWVYMLYSENSGLFYKGITTNLSARVERHNNALELATKHGVPWRLIWSAEKPNKSEAVIFEMKLKNLSRARLIKLMLKYAAGVAGHDELLLLKQLSPN